MVNHQVLAIDKQVLQSLRLIGNQQSARGHRLEDTHVHVAVVGHVDHDLRLRVDIRHFSGPCAPDVAVRKLLGDAPQYRAPAAALLGAEASHVGHVVVTAGREHGMQARRAGQRQPLDVDDPGLAEGFHLALLCEEYPIEVARHRQPQLRGDMGVDQPCRARYPQAVDVGFDALWAGVNVEIEIWCEAFGQSRFHPRVGRGMGEIHLERGIGGRLGRECPQPQHLLWNTKPRRNDTVPLP